MAQAKDSSSDALTLIASSYLMSEIKEGYQKVPPESYDSKDLAQFSRAASYVLWCHMRSPMHMIPVDLYQGHHLVSPRQLDASCFVLNPADEKVYFRYTFLQVVRVPEAWVPDETDGKVHPADIAPNLE